MLTLTAACMRKVKGVGEKKNIYFIYSVHDFLYFRIMYLYKARLDVRF